MLSKCARWLSSHFIKRGDISEDEREVYDYCFEIFLSTLLNGAFLVCSGLVLKMLLETLLFIISFVAFRMVGGGFHSSSHFRCFLTLAGVYGLMIAMIKLVPSDILAVITIAFLLIGTVIIYFWAPVEHENNPLDSKTRSRLSSGAHFLSLIFAFLMIGLSFFISTQLLFSLGYGMFAVAMSLTAVKIAKRRKERSSNQEEGKEI